MCRMLIAAAIALCAAVVAAVPARAANIFDKFDSAPMLRVDPSARFEAMGGAAGAVFWGVDPDHWANPALLGQAEGIRYEDGDRDYSSGVHFLAHREVLGYGGLGLALAGRPFQGLGGLKLKLEPVEGSDAYQPDPSATSGEFSEEIHSWGIGVSLSRLAATVAALRYGEAPAFTRYADLAFGYNHKSYEYAPAIPDLAAHATAMDWGLLVRAGGPFALGGAGGLPVRAEAAYAYSVQNANDVSASGSLGTAWRPHRHGLAACLGLGMPVRWRSWLPAWLAPGFEPLLSLGGAWDREFITMGSGSAVGDAGHTGAELGLANVAFLRFGKSRRTGQATGRASGYGLGLPIGRFAGLRYDHARIAWTDGLPETTLRGWSAWMNPLEFVHGLR